MKPRSESKSPMAKRQVVHDPTNKCCCPCSQHLRKVLAAETSNGFPIPLTPTKTTKKSTTFLQRSPHPVDSEMTNVLLRNQIKALEDELNYWKCRAQQFEQGNEGAATLYTETLKQENEKWKKKYMELSNQIKLNSHSRVRSDLSPSPVTQKRNSYMQSSNNPDVYREQEFLMAERKGLDVQLNQFQVKQSQMMKEMQRSQQVINELKGENQKLQDENKHLKTQLYQFDEELNQANQQIYELNGAILQERQRHDAIKGELNDKHYRAQQQVNELEDQRRNLVLNHEEALDNLSRELNQQQREKALLDQEIFNLTQKLNKLISENQMLQGQLQNNRLDYEEMLTKREIQYKDREHSFQMTISKLQQLLTTPQQVVQSEQYQSFQNQKPRTDYFELENIQQGIYQLKQQVQQQQGYTNQLLDEIEIWKTKVTEVHKQKQIELRLKEEEYIYTIEQLKISLQQQNEGFEHQLHTMKKIIDTKLQENEELRRSKNTMAVKLNEANLVHQRLMTELESVRFNNSQMQLYNSTYLPVSPERSVLVDSPQREKHQSVQKDTLLYRMEQDIKNLQMLLQEKQQESEHWKQQVQFIQQNY